MISAYAIDSRVYLVETERVADPTPPRTLPIGSHPMSGEQAIALAEQIMAAAPVAMAREGKPTPKVKP